MRSFIKAICKVFRSTRRRKKGTKHDRSYKTNWKLIRSSNEVSEKIPSKIKHRKRSQHRKNLSYNFNTELSSKPIDYPPPRALPLHENLRAGYSSIIEAAAQPKPEIANFAESQSGIPRQFSTKKPNLECSTKNEDKRSCRVAQASDGPSILTQLSEEFERVFGKKSKDNYSEATTAEATTIEDIVEQNVCGPAD